MIALPVVLCAQSVIAVIRVMSLKSYIIHFQAMQMMHLRKLLIFCRINYCANAFNPIIMKKINIYKIPVLMFLLLVVCGCNKNLDETEKNDTRTLVKFVTEDIPALNELVQVKFGVTPWDVILFKDKYIAVYEYRWEKSDGYIYILQYICL